MSINRRTFLVTAPAFAATACGQQRAAQDEGGPDFVCPMDKDVRQKGPGKCPRCGMNLVAGIPHPVEYGLRLSAVPARFRPGESVELRFEVLDPHSGARVLDFEIIHEKLFHLFLMSSDLGWFAHEHPERGDDGIFRFRTTALPGQAAFRILCDFYPKGGTPQLISRTLFAPGAKWKSADLAPDMARKTGQNLTVELVTEPAQPLAGFKTFLFFRLNTDEGLEQYLGAWGHLLAASADTVDLIHTHPAYPDKGRLLQFNILFPRPGVHRVWVQFQRLGVVNTFAFNVPVKALG